MKSTYLIVLVALAALSCGAVRAQAQPPPAAGHADASADVEKQLAAARERLREAVGEVAELSGRLGERYGQPFMGPGFRAQAVIGVQIDARGGAGGARVAAVSPGGPAAEAGVEAGDVITAIDGVDLSKGAEPARALVERMRALQPGAKVVLKVQHAGKVRDVEITSRAPPMFGPWVPGDARAYWGQAFGGPPGFAGGRAPQFGDGPHGWEGARDGYRTPPGEQDSGRDGLRLATVTPRLGGYFGAKAGVLVTQAGMPSVYKLEDGDIITAIDGREPSSAEQAWRILRSYRPGEKVAIKVLRDHKALQLDVVIAAR